MNPIRNLARDLVERKLWPVALLLLVAAVAIPVILGGGADASDPAADVAAIEEQSSATSTTARSALQLVGPASAASRAGRQRDPFRQPATKAEAQPGAGDDTASRDGAAGAPAGGAAADGPATGAPSTPSEQTGGTAAAAPVYQRTEVRWYEATAGKQRPLARLTPLGGLVDTAVLYLGVTKSSGNYAVFLLGPNATSDGEAKCEDGDCRVIGLKGGQTQIVTVQSPNGGQARQYHLDVVEVESVRTTAAKARTMRLKVHPDGRDVMRELWLDGPTAAALRPIQFDRDSGLLVKTGASTGDAAQAP